MTIFWIGGPAAAGKTTVSRLFARRHGYLWYSVDAHAYRHENRAAAAGLHDPATGPGTFDRRPFILSDLDGTAGTVVVEGAFVTPAVAGVGPNALWLMPSAEEQQARLNVRNAGESHDGYLWGRSLIEKQLEGTDATVLSVDGESVEQTLAAVERVFTPLLATAPAAESRTARQSLIRAGNTQLITQATDRTRPTITLDCECATPTCTALVTLPTSQATTLTTQPPPTILAPTHTPT